MKPFAGGRRETGDFEEQGIVGLDGEMLMGLFVRVPQWFLDKAPPDAQAVLEGYINAGHTLFGALARRGRR